jgi:hypothetical protein
MDDSNTQKPETSRDVRIYVNEIAVVFRAGQEWANHIKTVISARDILIQVLSDEDHKFVHAHVKACAGVDPQGAHPLPNFPRAWDLFRFLLWSGSAKRDYMHAVEELKGDFFEAASHNTTTGARRCLVFCFSVRSGVCWAKILCGCLSDKTVRNLKAVLIVFLGKSVVQQIWWQIESVWRH